ncbi:hypothetical protein [Oenococcus sp.]|uniref:hypothetical protein n=1 Tax=Oenococcus sp. TaxID=1979414 RepID=UPI0039E950EF
MIDGSKTVLNLHSGNADGFPPIDDTKELYKRWEDYQVLNALASSLVHLTKQASQLIGKIDSGHLITPVYSLIQRPL